MPTLISAQEARERALVIKAQKQEEIKAKIAEAIETHITEGHTEASITLPVHLMDEEFIAFLENEQGYSVKKRGTNANPIQEGIYSISF